MNIAELQTFLDNRLLTIASYDITVGQVILVPVVALLGYALIGFIVSLAVRAMQRRAVNADLIQVVRRAVYILGIVILVITMLDLLNIPLTAFAFVSGAIAIGFGFGAQNIINNFISGWILIWERPIRINDFIELGDTTGTVEEINTRSTRIRRVDGVHLLVPNSRLLEETVVNWTLVDKLLRCVVRVGVAYGSDVVRVREILQEVVTHPSVLEDPPAQVIFEDFGDNALIFDTYFWVESGAEKSAREIRSEVRFEIYRRFHEAGIVIAFPQRDVHLDGTVTLKNSVQDS
ncbi:MAG: mechanosensitive ion channel [Pseudomonadales bacterium]|nr:mechanosensitive ion channel [Pseudomonadales bacterium]